MPSLRSVIRPLGLVAALFAIGCAPQIGDSCNNANDCSINGDRVCDTAQPDGYCTVFECQPNRCPDDAVCVRFNPQPSRGAIVACMRHCSSSGDCRQDQDYRCLSPEQLLEDGLEVEILDDDTTQSFCVAGQPEAE